MERYLVRYGEIFLKSDPVRRQWEQTLARNIRERLPGVAVRTGRGGSGSTAPSTARPWPGSSAWSRSRPRSRAFSTTSTGLHSSTGQTASKETARPPSPYGYNTVGTHPFSSQEKAAALGALIGEAYPALRVNLGEPDVEPLRRGIRDGRCHLFRDDPRAGGASARNAGDARGARLGRDRLARGSVHDDETRLPDPASHGRARGVPRRFGRGPGRGRGRAAPRLPAPGSRCTSSTTAISGRRRRCSARRARSGTPACSASGACPVLPLNTPPSTAHPAS